MTVGESRTEAILYGIVLWGTTSVLLLWLAANGVQAGMSTAMTMQNVDTQVQSGEQTTMTPEEREAAMQNAREVGSEGAWWAFAGILFSMIASIAGALIGPVELTVRRDVRRTRDTYSTPAT